MAIYGGSGGSGRRVINVGLQEADGSSVDLSGVNAYVPPYKSAELLPKRTVIKREMVSPEQPGFAHVTTGEHVEISVEAEVLQNTISSANASDYPYNFELLLASGFEVISDSTNKCHTFLLTSGQGSALTMQRYWLNNDNSANRFLKAYDIRGNTVISGNAKEPINLSFKGFGLNSSPSLIEVVNESAFTNNVNYPAASLLPTLTKGATIQIYNVSQELIYSGGSLGSVGTDGRLVGFEINPNREPNLKSVADAQSGISGVQLGTPQPTMNLKLECNDIVLDRWQNSVDIIEVRMTFPSPSNANNTMSILAYGVIGGDLSSFELSEGRYLVNMPLNLVYPLDVSDNSSTKALSATQLFTAASNRGLFLMPATTLPKAVLAIQFATSA